MVIENDKDLIIRNMQGLEWYFFLLILFGLMSGFNVKQNK